MKNFNTYPNEKKLVCRGPGTTETDQIILKWIDDREVVFFELGTDDFAHLGLNAGDTLLIRVAEKFDEHRLSMFHMIKENKWTMGFAYDNFGDISVDRRNQILRYKNNSLCYLGYIWKVIKPYEAESGVEIEKTVEPEQTTELSVKCDGCEKEASGSRAFLTSMAWRLKKDTALCVGCW